MLGEVDISIVEGEQEGPPRERWPTIGAPEEVADGDHRVVLRQGVEQFGKSGWGCTQQPGHHVPAGQRDAMERQGRERVRASGDEPLE